MRPPVIIGGGPAGSAVALTLRQAGQAVTLIERAPGATDKVCGDFLGASAARIAEAAGLSLAELGGRLVTHVRLIRRTGVTEVRLPFRAVALSRRVFDEALLRRAEAMGAEVIRGRTARPPVIDGDDLVVEVAGDAPLVTGTVFLASGQPDTRTLGVRGMESRGIAQPRRTGGVNAYKMHVRLRPSQREALAGIVDLMILPAGQAILQSVESNQATLCLMSRRHGAEAGWEDVLADFLLACPHLARRLDGAVPLLARPVIARGIPFGHLHRPRVSDHDGLYRVGDQAAMLTSLVADGVSVAMRGGVRAAECWLSGAGAADYHRKLRGMLWPRVRFMAEHVMPQAEDARRDPPDAADAPADTRLSLRWSRLIA
jgi:flavin-dependent dehydrogenase